MRGRRRGFAEHGAVNLGIDPTGTAHGYLTLMPVPSGNTVMLSTRSAAVLALVTPHAGQRVASVQQLMAWFRLTPAEARYRALKEASAQRDKTIGQLIDESLDFYGIKSREDARDLVRLARTHSKLTEDQALAVAQEQIKAVRRQP